MLDRNVKDHSSEIGNFSNKNKDSYCLYACEVVLVFVCRSTQGKLHENGQKALWRIKECVPSAEKKQRELSEQGNASFLSCGQRT